jgi:glucose 1-dehydrogenase
MTSEETYYERGINLLHGYLTEYFVDDQEYIVKVPPGLKHLHVLMEPISCAAKAVQQAFEVQRRMRVWRPKIAYVMGAGQIGLLATLILRLRGLEVYTFARRPKPRLNSEIVEGYGATYVSTQDMTPEDIAAKVGKADLIVEATGNSTIAFESMRVLGHNGVLVWHSVTGGDRRAEVQADRLNIEFVLGNKLLLGSVNANREHFEAGIRDLALGEVMYPGVTQRILTNPVKGLDNYQEMMRLLVEDTDALKVFVEVAE